MFVERLKEFRKELDLNKRQMAKKLDVTEGYYNVIENNKKNPSKNFIDKLVNLSNRPEEYWVYGIEEDEYIDARNDFKCIKKAIEPLLEFNINTDDIFKNVVPGSIEDLLATALKADIEHLKLKKESNK